jgi:hypothetical protein
MPEMGSQPVRAARNTRHRQQDERRRANRAGHRPTAAAARDDAQRQADERSEQQRSDRQDGGVGGAFGNEVAHGTAILHGIAKVEPRGAGDPVAVLRADRLVEAVSRALLRDRLLAGAGPQRFGDEVAGRQAREHQRGRRDPDHQHERERQAPREIPDQWTTATVSGRQNNCGRYSDGVRFITRDEWAT